MKIIYLAILRNKVICTGLPFTDAKYILYEKNEIRVADNIDANISWNNCSSTI